MKNFTFMIAFLAILLVSQGVQAQVIPPRQNAGTGTGEFDPYANTDPQYSNTPPADPQYADPGYGDAQYDYLPEIDAYYYIPGNEYVYMNNGNWIFSPYLPSIYAGFDFASSYRVPIRGARPYLHADYYRSRYASYRRNGWGASSYARNYTGAAGIANGRQPGNRSYQGYSPVRGYNGQQENRYERGSVSNERFQHAPAQVNDNRGSYTRNEGSGYSRARESGYNGGGRSSAYGGGRSSRGGRGR